MVGLAFAYDVLRWQVAASVLLSLLVSAIPAYFLNTRFVWPRSNHSRSGYQLLAFVAIALVGALITIGAINASLAVTRLDALRVE